MVPTANIPKGKDAKNTTLPPNHVQCIFYYVSCMNVPINLKGNSEKPIILNCKFLLMGRGGARLSNYTVDNNL